MMSNFEAKINTNLKNIWRYAAFYLPVQEKFRLTVGEGWTPEIEIKLAETGSPLIFKREDLNPNGSHKDRGLAYQVSAAYQAGEKNLIISSSGNAAISAAAYCQEASIKLFAFVSPKIEKAELAKLSKINPKIIISQKPISLAEYASKKYHIKNIKTTVDKNSIYGYKSIAFEIFEKIGKIEAIFIPTSSAGTLLGIAEAYNDLISLGEIKRMPALHIIQTTAIHPIAKYFDRNFVFEKENLAKGISLKKNPRLGEVLRVIKESDGSGWIVSNSEILEAQKILNENGIETGFESAACFAGLIKAAKIHQADLGKVVCLLTGSTAQDKEKVKIAKKCWRADSKEEVDEIISCSM